MTKELYNELVNGGFITDTFLTLDKINESNIELRDIVTQPSAYNYFLNKYSVVVNEEPTIIDENNIIGDHIIVDESNILSIEEIDEKEADDDIHECVVIEDSIEEPTINVENENLLEIEDDITE